MLKYIILCKQNFDYIQDTRVIYNTSSVAALSRFASCDAVKSQCGGGKSSVKFILMGKNTSFESVSNSTRQILEQKIFENT
jgi:hypothetical protein